MASKRKAGVQHIEEILESGSNDYLGVLDNGEGSEIDELEEMNNVDSHNPYKYHLDENPDYNDPYYYDNTESLQKETAFYKNSKATKQQNPIEEEEGEESDDENESTVQDSESDNSDESDDEDSNDESEDAGSDDESEDAGSDDESEDISSDDESEEENTNNNDSQRADNDSVNKQDKKNEIIKDRRKSEAKSGRKSNSSTEEKQLEKIDEYADGDSSDEEEIRNTIGSIPTEWYDEYDHIGYNVAGEKILKPDRGDSLDEFLKRVEDPNYMRTVVDRMTGQDVELVEGDLDLIHRLVKAHVPSRDYDLYEPFQDLYSHEVMETPLSGRPEHKRSFLPSRTERAKVSKMVHAIKQGLIYRHQRQKRYQYRDIWNGEDHVPVPMRRRLNPDYKAPAARLPTNSNSYNPPPEFLPSKKQVQWLETNKSGRQKMLILSRLPTKYNSVREVPTHPTYVMDFFNRCLDLYMSSRLAYRKVQGHSKDLLPNLPRPRDLRPYPTKEALLFSGHRAVVRAMAIHPNGEFLATGSDDHTVRVWETKTGRCVRVLELGDAVQSLAWNPNTRVFVLAVAVGKCVVLINPETYLMDKTIITRTNALFDALPDQGDYIAPAKVKNAVKWALPSSEERSQGYRMVIKHSHSVKQVVWHQQGDYFASLQPDANTSSVVTHQLSRHRSQIPFARAAVHVTALSFHPKKPYFYIASQGRVRVYSLLEKKLIRLIKTSTSSEWISSISIHPTGDHFITGSTGKRITWYEMENTSRPFTLRYHHGAIRSVDFHPKYPLFASASDDGRVIITHSMVYSDWLKDPLLVPLKELRNHQFFDKLCVLQVVWHPRFPYLFTAGADGTVRMWQ